MNLVKIFKISVAVSLAFTSLNAFSHDGEIVKSVTTLPPGSNMMLRDRIGVSGDLEVIISDVVIPANAEVPEHYHPGEEFLYVIEGSARHYEEGKPMQLLSTGTAYKIEKNKAHAPEGGDDGARAIVFRVHVAGQPERVLVDGRVDKGK